MPKITPKNPDRSWLDLFLEKSLTQTEVYKIDTPKVDLKLDQNESPFDWPDQLKKRICDKLAKVAWNRYPQAYPTDLENLVAEYAGVDQGCVLLSPGSNHLNALTISTFAKQAKGKVVVARPSFALYESHCKYEGIPYETWDLDDNLEYNLEKLPKLPKGSLVVFATPNNPVGNNLKRSDLITMLKENPDSLFISDEAYFEFSKEPSTDLLKEFSNLIIIRTFSKTMGAAGVRLGYLIGAPEYVSQLRKVMLPFLINQYSYIAAKEVLSDKETLKGFLDTVEMIISEREKMYAELKAVGDSKGFYVKESCANFLLIKWENNDRCQTSYKALIEKGILVRNVSKGPGLEGCYRLSLGTPEQNVRVLNAFKEL